MRSMRHRLLAKLLPGAVSYKGRHTQRQAWEHVGHIVTHRENRVLAPCLALRPTVMEKFRHDRFWV